MSVLLASVSRSQGIPTKVVTGCAVAKCNWWNVWCKASNLIVGDIGHTWTYSWIYKWTYTDATVNHIGEKLEDIAYYDEGICDTSSLGETYNDCFTHEKCKKWL